MDFALQFGVYAGIVAGISVSLFFLLFRFCYIYQIECKGIKSSCNHKKVRVDMLNRRSFNRDVKSSRKALKIEDARFFTFDKNKRDYEVQYGVMLKPFSFTLKFLRIGIYFRWFRRRKKDTSYAYDILQDPFVEDGSVPECMKWISLDQIGMMIWRNEINANRINIDKKFF